MSNPTRRCKNRSQCFFRPQLQKEKRLMKINYFEHTDTALIHFSENEIVETREVSENVYLDLDKDGNLVSMTVEHAGEKANIEKFSFERLSKIAS